MLFGPEFGDESSVTSMIVGDLGTTIRLALFLSLCPPYFIVSLGGILDLGLSGPDDNGSLFCAARTVRDTDTARTAWEARIGQNGQQVQVEDFKFYLS